MNLIKSTQKKLEEQQDKNKRMLVTARDKIKNLTGKF